MPRSVICADTFTSKISFNSLFEMQLYRGVYVGNCTIIYGFNSLFEMRVCNWHPGRRRGGDAEFQFSV